MSKRLGSETIQHWAKPPQQFGSTGTPYLVAEYRGCWPNYGASDEGVGPNAAILQTVVSWWIPHDVAIVSNEDFFVWPRFDEKHDVEGDVGRLVDRRGRLRASIVPVEVR